MERDMPEINFEDYLNEEERKDIVREVFRHQCFDAFKKGSERIFDNAACAVVVEMVNEVIGEDVNEIIKAKAIEKINALTEYSVFKRKDYWEKEDSVAYVALQNAMKEAEPLIKDRVNAVVGALNEDRIMDMTQEAVGRLLYERIYPKAA